MTPATQEPPRHRRLIGIVGGLGPYAHLALERLLLEQAGPVDNEQQYPSWLLSSIPQTPDRTPALKDRGPSPVPLLVESLRRLEPAADFAIIACNTAHAFLGDLREAVSLPILDWISATARQLAADHGNRAKVGLLATDGTLHSAVYPAAASVAAPGLSWLSLPELAGGDRLQQELVMRTLYGVKTGFHADIPQENSHEQALSLAIQHLRKAGADVVILGCTELPLAFDSAADHGLAVVDPLRIAASQALRIAAGELPLPSSD